MRAGVRGEEKGSEQVGQETGTERLAKKDERVTQKDERVAHQRAVTCTPKISHLRGQHTTAPKRSHIKGTLCATKVFARSPYKREVWSRQMKKSARQDR